MLGPPRRDLGTLARDAGPTWRRAAFIPDVPRSLQARDSALAPTWPRASRETCQQDSALERLGFAPRSRGGSLQPNVPPPGAPPQQALGQTAWPCPAPAQGHTRASSERDAPRARLLDRIPPLRGTSTRTETTARRDRGGHRVSVEIVVASTSRFHASRLSGSSRTVKKNAACALSGWRERARTPAA